MGTGGREPAAVARRPPANEWRCGGGRAVSASTRQTALATAEAESRRASVRECFRAHLSPVFFRLSRRAAGNPPSVPTCEKVPTSDAGDPENGGDDGASAGLSSVEEDALTTAVASDLGGADVDALADAVTRGVDAVDALQSALGREEVRQENVVALINAGEVAHAKRLAKCGRQSVQLECPDGLAGGCGSTDNYVPISCDSRLCPDCGGKRQGQAVGRFSDAVESWENPTMLRFGLDRRVEPTEEAISAAVDELREAFGKLRRRVIPVEGRHQATESGEVKQWVWKRDGGAPADHYWKSALLGAGRHDLARRWQKRYVEQGRGIPADEVFRSGFYGIDVKQGEDGSVYVHVHVLADLPYVPQAALAALWDDLTGAPVVDVRRVEERGERDETGALMEVVGYAAKPPEYESAETAVAYATALKGSKLIQPFGELHGNTPDSEAQLVCADCERTPSWWNYEGTVDGRHATMGRTWDDPTRGENDPPNSVE